jgi:hypothetical protein
MEKEKLLGTRVFDAMLDNNINIILNKDGVLTIHADKEDEILERRHFTNVYEAFKFVWEDIVRFDELFDYQVTQDSPAESLKNRLGFYHDTENQSDKDIPWVEAISSDNRTGLTDLNFHEKPLVYFVASEGADAVKIGYTENIKSRIGQIRTGCPLNLNVLCVFMGGVREERKFHKEFATVRMNGEWFTLSGRIAAFLDATRAKEVEKKVLKMQRSESAKKGFETRQADKVA